MNTIVDIALLLLMFVTGWLVLYVRHRHALKRLDVAKYHAHADMKLWGRTSLLGRKIVRWCPDCGAIVHDYKPQTMHDEHHLYIFGLEDRITELERVIAEARGGGPAEEPAAVPWDGLTGELVEHAGAVDVTAGEIEARADDPEPEEFKTFREKYGDLIRP